MKSLRDTINKLPRMTIQLHRARREIVDVLDTYISTIDGAINLIPEIENSINDILKQANSQ